MSLTAKHGQERQFGQSEQDGEDKSERPNAIEGKARITDSAIWDHSRDQEKDADLSDQRPGNVPALVASEDYSVFTVPQKRAIILAGSFIAWFSPMSGSIYYPALNQVQLLHTWSQDTYVSNNDIDRSRLERLKLPGQYHGDHIPSKHTHRRMDPFADRHI